MIAWRVYVIGAAVLISLGVITAFIGGKGHFLIWLAAQRSHVADHYFYHVTKLGEEHSFIVISLLLWLQSWRKMLVIPVLGGLVTLVSFILKSIFTFERPSLYLQKMGWDGPLTILDYPLLSGYASFPSGHSLAAWALFTCTAALIRKTWVSVLCLFLAASVSISRVYLMVHFLIDVAAGAAIGFAVGFGVYYVHSTYLKKRELGDAAGM